LSPLLFNIFLELIIARALNGVDSGFVLSGHVMNNLRFADDMASVADNQHHLQAVVDGIKSDCTKMGLRINIDKTEVQLISKRKTEMNITVGGNKLKQVREFVYLGGKFDEEGGSKPDVQTLQRRIGLACDALKRLSKIWRSRDISPSTKVKVFETLVLSILLYNAETWTLTLELNKRLRAFEMSCLRRIAGVTRQDRARNEVIRSNLKIQGDVDEKVELRRLSYFGHVARMNQNRFPYIAMQGRVNG